MTLKVEFFCIFLSRKTLNPVPARTRVLIWITRVHCFWNYLGFSGSVLPRVPSLAQRIYSDAPQIDREVDLSHEISLPLLNGNLIKYELVSCTEHVHGIGSNGTRGHFMSHLFDKDQFWKCDTNGVLIKSTMQQVRRSSMFLYKRQDVLT